jgi:hypothetical protein
MAEWNYGNAFERHPIEYGQQAIFNKGSILAPGNIFDPLAGRGSRGTEPAAGPAG